MLAKSKLNSIQALISKTLIASVISHDEFVLVNVIKNEKRNQKFKELIKFIEDFSWFMKQNCCFVWSVEKIQKVKIQKLQRQKTEG